MRRLAARLQPSVRFLVGVRAQLEQLLGAAAGVAGQVGARRVRADPGRDFFRRDLQRDDDPLIDRDQAQLAPLVEEVTPDGFLGGAAFTLAYLVIVAGSIGILMRRFKKEGGA